jgi:hypothetical protein
MIASFRPRMTRTDKMTAGSRRKATSPELAGLLSLPSVSPRLVIYTDYSFSGRLASVSVHSRTGRQLYPSAAVPASPELDERIVAMAKRRAFRSIAGRYEIA